MKHYHIFTVKTIYLIFLCGLNYIMLFQTLHAVVFVRLLSIQTILTKTNITYPTLLLVVDVFNFEIQLKQMIMAVI